jgi:hypothetical protein
VASIEETPRDGAALFTRGPRDDDCELLRHVPVPFCPVTRSKSRGISTIPQAFRCSFLTFPSDSWFPLVSGFS